MPSKPPRKAPEGAKPSASSDRWKAEELIKSRRGNMLIAQALYYFVHHSGSEEVSNLEDMQFILENLFPSDANHFALQDRIKASIADGHTPDEALEIAKASDQ